jgi:DNA-binding transcriptional MerR regulator
MGGAIKMKDLLESILDNLDYEPPGWENEFYVSISRAAELSGLSESQIRYFEGLSGVNVGQREGPKERNRVYSRQDVRLLRAVYLCPEARPAEIAQVVKEHQERILAQLGQVTLPQLLRHEEAAAGRDYLLTGLVSILLSLWQELLTPQGVVVQGAILGPQKDSWKASLLQCIDEKSSIDLAHSLVIWSASSGNANPADYNIFFSRRTWYLPFPDHLVWDNCRFSHPEEPFTVAFLWHYSGDEVPASERERVPSFDLDQPAAMLATLVMSCLKHLLDDYAGKSGEPVSIYSRVVSGKEAFLQGLSLILHCCIERYFPDCYAYIATFVKDGRLEVLEQCGESSAGHIPRYLNSARILDTHNIPWWITFVKEHASIALDRDAARRPETREERGSVVCLPLIGQDQVVGVLGVENTCTDPDIHCLATRNGVDGPSWLRFLSCVAEIAADFVNRRASSLERIERSRLVHTRHDTVQWHWNIYQLGGLNYSSIIEAILDWTEEVGIISEKLVNVILVDIAREDVLARTYKGFDIIISILERTRARIRTTIQNDPIASAFAAKRQLVLFDEPVTDHLVLAAAGIPRDYLLVFLERIRRIWQATNDRFEWEGNPVTFSSQVAVCNFSDLGSHERGIATELMMHHLWMLSLEMFEKTPLTHVLEYDAKVITA